MAYARPVTPGDRFGLLTVVKEVARVKNKRMVLCRCDCGRETIARLESLRSGNTRGCGCGRIGRAATVFAGNRYGRLVVLREERPPILGRRYACRCDCGAELVVEGKRLRNGNTKSCGCLQREHAAATGRASATHGHTRKGKPSRTYVSWQAMHNRCEHPGDIGYPNYGGRGITVCERWSGSAGFANFLADMGERPPRRSIDRIDNDGNYEPSNCRWATAAEQNANRRKPNRTPAGRELPGERGSRGNSEHPSGCR